MLLKRTTEDYLKTIYLLSLEGTVRSVQIARALDISKASVSVTGKKLVQDGYVRFDRRNVRLTDAGLAIAQATYERHQTSQTFLQQLGVEEDTAFADACQMEHAISPESFSAIKGLLDRRLMYQEG